MTIDITGSYGISLIIAEFYQDVPLTKTSLCMILCTRYKKVTKIRVCLTSRKCFLWIIVNAILTFFKLLYNENTPVMSMLAFPIML